MFNENTYVSDALIAPSRLPRVSRISIALRGKLFALRRRAVYIFGAARPLLGAHS